VTAQRTLATRRAHGKVNLALAVGPRNAPAPEGDGLHPIASWMAAIDLADTLALTRLPEGRASRYAILWAEDAPRSSPVDWSISKDLAVRAHLALEREVGAALPVQMKVLKRVPVGAGLAGGSSDAAASLLAVRDLFSLEVSDERLAEIGLGLGSDVPFFLDEERETPRAALVEDVGGRVERVGRPRVEGGAVRLALIAPEFGCDTGAVYGAFDAGPARAERMEEAAALARAAEVDEAAIFNDLGGPAQSVEPRLSAVLERAREASGRRAHVTGSGSGVFVVAPRDEAERAAMMKRLREALGDCVVVETSVV